VLTAAALALPGLAPGAAGAAEDDGFGLQYGSYREGDRKLYGVHSRFHPIEVDNLHASWHTTWLDRWKLSFDYVEDTWSGATPVTTAPLLLGGNRPSAPDGVSGATPLIQGDLYLDSALRPVEVDALGQVVRTDTRLVHTLSSASPETRKQGSVELGYDWSALHVGLGAGLSLEDDYESGFVRLGGRWDLDQKRTSLDLALRAASSDVEALLDHDAVPYFDASAYPDKVHVYPSTGDRELRDDRTDWGVEAGVTRVLSRDSVLESRIGWARSSGYLENPYKVMEVAFIDPAQQFLAPPGGYYAQVRALLEQRPDDRDQWSWNTRYALYVERFDASLQLGYQLFHDDWGIDAHTLEASWGQPLGRGWTVTPRVRFYSQKAADFYETLLITPQAFRTVVSDPDTGDIISITPFDHALLPRHFSSDHRLSGFGALGGGLSVRKEFARGVRLLADFEYYTHQGDLLLGGGGEGDYADFDYYQFSVGIELDASALNAFGYRSPRAHGGHGEHRSVAPAGVMLDHTLDAGELMVGYRYTWSGQTGSMLHGSSSAGDAAVLAAGCEGNACRTVPQQMDMHMHMLELGWAPTERLTLMAMPQFVDMTMELRPLAGAAPDVHGAHDHTTGGLGDLPLFALVRLFQGETHRLHAGLGVSIPTGDIDLNLRRTHQEERGRIHYGMQLGSGTWDLLPSLTYTGGLASWVWGGQVGGAKRLERENASGYALGDAFHATLWGGRRLNEWLTVSLRGVYTHQDEIRGRYDEAHDDSGPMDFPSNYGGEYWDLGIGATISLAEGYLAGNELAVEWLEPLRDDVNGYQLERRGALFAVWSVGF
jgi:hypothetical protein